MSEQIEPGGPARIVAGEKGHTVISIPINLKRRGGRKVIVAPPGASAPAAPTEKKDNPYIQALLQAHRWLQLLESGKARTLTEIARQEKCDASYVTRIVNLTLLAPEIVEAILDDTLPEQLTLLDLAVATPRLWEEQRGKLGV